LVEPDGGLPDNLGDLADSLDACPELRSASPQRASERFRNQLDAMSLDAPLDAPVTVLAGDLLTLTKAVMSRLR